MNPINVAWIVLTWLLGAAAFGGYFAGDPRIALGVVVVMGILIAGQTIGCDRAERYKKGRRRTRETNRHG